MLLKTDGVFAASDLGPWWQNALLALWSGMTRSRRVLFAMPKNPAGLMAFLKARMEANEYRAIVDREYSLEAIADAYRYVETEEKVGIVVVSPSAAGE